MSQAVSITPEQLQELLRAVVMESKKLNPLEQKEFDEKMAQERRKARMVADLGRAEEEAMKAKRNGCSHMRWPATAGKNAGHSAPRGALGAEWCTGGQAYQDGTAATICMRCSTVWRFKPTPEYYTAIVQNGLLGEAPPSDEHIICEGCLVLKSSCKCAELALKDRMVGVEATA